MTLNRPDNERGAALITVLMIIAAMSVVALGVTQAVTTSTQRARSLDAQAQLRFYAAGAEEVAKIQLTQILEPLESRLSADLPNYGVPVEIPVEGGIVIVTLRDASNCFDLNQLITDADDEVNEALEAFRAILIDLEVDQNDAIRYADTLLDWMDNDSIPGQSGAEDPYYMGMTPAYRTSGQPLDSLTELRALRDFEVEFVARLKTVACTRPTYSKAPKGRLNINTMTEAQAPLLRQAFSGALALEDARNLILDRPLGGWGEVEDFLEEDVVEVINPELRRMDQLSVVTSLVEVSADVAYRGHIMQMRYVFEAIPGQPVRTLHRQRVG